MPDEDNAVIWMRPETTGRGRAPGYSREQIAKVGVAIADSEGLESVSMRRVAKEIGTGPMSLYRYVHNKGELHILMADHVITERNDPPAPADWADALRGMARTMRRLILDHPWWGTIQAENPLIGPNAMRSFESSMQALSELGVDIDEMMEISGIVRTYALGYANAEVRRLATLQEAGIDDATMMMNWGPWVWSLIRTGEYPNLERVIVDAKGPHEQDPDAPFERGLERILTGIRATLPSDR